MQGQQGPSKEWFPSQELAGMNGTGKHRPVPQRPPGMVRLDQPPAERRVARPQHQAPSPGRRRRRFLLLGGIFIPSGLLACVTCYAVVNPFNVTSVSSVVSTAAAHFL